MNSKNSVITEFLSFISWDHEKQNNYAKLKKNPERYNFMLLRLALNIIQLNIQYQLSSILELTYLSLLWKSNTF